MEKEFYKRAPFPQQLGVYVHVPFCASPCAFCAFYKEAPKRELIEKYLCALKKEWNLRYKGEKIDTFFWGGGTPSLLMPKDLEFIGRIFPKTSTLMEWTVECAPSTLKKEKLQLLKNIGVTRISLGIQSFNEKILSVLGRRHSLRQIYQAYEWIRTLDFDLNFDLMFYIPHQTIADWEKDLSEAIRLNPDHISTYCLTYEGNTPIKKRFAKTYQNAAFQGERFYRRTWKFLEDHGFQHYEVSNFARPGKQCQHNLHTWQMGQWLGIGPAASSQYRGRRFTNCANIQNWYDTVTFAEKTGNPSELFCIEEDKMELSPKLLFEDALIFGLRTRQGVDLSALGKALRIDYESYQNLFNGLISAGKMRFENYRYSLTDRGLLLADAIGREILSFS